MRWDKHCVSSALFNLRKSLVLWIKTLTFLADRTCVGVLYFLCGFLKSCKALRNTSCTTKPQFEPFRSSIYCNNILYMEHSHKVTFSLAVLKLHFPKFSSITHFFFTLFLCVRSLYTLTCYLSCHIIIIYRIVMIILTQCYGPTTMLRWMYCIYDTMPSACISQYLVSKGVSALLHFKVYYKF